MTQLGHRHTSREPVGMSARRHERIAPALQEHVDERGCPGSTTLVPRRGQLAHAGRIGWQDRSRNSRRCADVVARQIEVISGRRSGTPAERLFGPLGMTDTAFGVLDPSAAASPPYGLLDLFAEDMTLSALAGRVRRRRQRR